MAFKIFLDTNIFLDHLLDRNPHSSAILKVCEDGLAQGYASSASFYTLAYLIRKQVTVLETKKILGDYLRFIAVLPTTKYVLKTSLESTFNDLEDSFQYFTALDKEQLDFFVTNNLRDFQNTSRQLPVVSSEEFVSKHFN